VKDLFAKQRRHEMRQNSQLFWAPLTKL